MSRRSLLQLRRGRPARRTAALTCCLGLVVTAACTGEPSAEDERRQLRDDLIAETDGALGEEEAACVADALHDAFGEDSYEDVLGADDDRDGARADEVRAEVIDIFSECDALEAVVDPLD